jgi:hypothetical protein
MNPITVSVLDDQVRTDPPPSYESITGTHRILLTRNSRDELINQVCRMVRFFPRLAVAVPTYRLLDTVYDLLKSTDLGSEVDMRRYVTRGYLYQKHFDTTFEYEENTPPWQFTARIDDASRHAIESSEKWQEVLTKQKISEELFEETAGSKKQIAVILTNALSSPERVGEVAHNNARVIVLNPGVNDFQEYFCKKYIGKDKNEKRFSVRRPVEHHLPSMLRSVPVTYITEREFLTELLQASYALNGYRIEPRRKDQDSLPNHEVTVFQSDITYTKNRGLFPIVFEHVNKTAWGGNGICIGNGIGSSQSFNRIHLSVDPLDGPIGVSLGQPHIDLLAALSRQLDQDIQVIKKKLIVDNASAVLRRAKPGAAVYFVADPQTVGWLRAIPQLRELDAIKIQVDHRSYRRLKVRGCQNPLAPVLNDPIRLAATLSKSKSAFDRYVRNNGIEGVALEKLIVGFMLSVTFAIRKGGTGLRAQPSFAFGETFAQELDDGSGSIRSKLFRLCNHVMQKYVGGDVKHSAVCTRYVKAMKDRGEAVRAVDLVETAEQVNHVSN